MPLLTFVLEVSEVLNLMLSIGHTERLLITTTVTNFCVAVFHVFTKIAVKYPFTNNSKQAALSRFVV
jgi:hypothetical protein